MPIAQTKPKNATHAGSVVQVVGVVVDVAFTDKGLPPINHAPQTTPRCAVACSWGQAPTRGNPGRAGHCGFRRARAFTVDA